MDLQKQLKEIVAKYKITVKALKRQLDIQSLISSLLQLSLKDETTDKLLSQSLDLILSLKWLSFESKGSIFVVEENPDLLIMKGVKGLAEPIVKECARLPFGKCLCGKAAQEGRIKFQSTLGDEHEVSYDGISPHGHYCVPIKFNEDLVGVLNIYVKDGYSRNDDDEDFLLTVANTLAGIIVRKNLEENLKQLATTDRLTGAFNRRKFDEIINREIELTKRTSYTFCMALLDIDHFKKINDNHGHLIGDNILKLLVGVVMSEIREIDYIVRWGGDEFIIIASATDIEGISKMINRIKAVIENQTFDNVETVTVSVGITQFKDGDTKDDIFKRADEGLYKAKQNGRNKVERCN